MSYFGFPGPSDSPSTPNRKNRSLFSQPSTTPAGPPPSHLADFPSHISTTPAGPPPTRSLFGSSYAAPNTYARKANTPARRGFMVPQSSPPLDEDANGEEYEDDVMSDEGRGVEPPRDMERSALASSFMSSTRGLKRSRNGMVKEQLPYASIAKGMVAQAPKDMGEPSDLVLRQEEIVRRMDQLVESQPSEKDTAVSEGVVELTKVWQHHTEPRTKEAGMGPRADASPITRASYLSTLLLQLHHPHTTQASQQQARPQRGVKRSQPGRTTIPRALLDWLNTYHTPFPDDYNAVWRYQPSPAAHERFWDSVYYSLIRGKYDQAIRLLTDAGWENAITDDQDSAGDGFNDRQLNHIENVVEHCTELLRACPAVRHDDWDIKGSDWAVFRQSVRTALQNLELYAGETEEDDDTPATNSGNVFRMGDSMSLSTASRKAESKLPWSIYEALKLLYTVLLGDVDALCDNSQDWLEASIYLTVWWDGDDDSTAALNKSQSLRRSILQASTRGKTREVDLTPGAAYRRRLVQAFDLVVGTGEDAVFEPDTLDPIQVGLACVLNDNVDAAVRLLRSWSVPVVAGVVEVAALAGWLPHAGGRDKEDLLQRGFSSEDLMVLSHGPSLQPSKAGEVERDDVLMEYAELLAQRNDLQSDDGRLKREGWELAVGVLGRLSDAAAGQAKVEHVLEALQLDGEERVDKVLSACQGLGLGEQAKAIAERYADDLASSAEGGNQPAYGSALIYYARAHATAKLKDTLSLLTSCCLLHSAAYPAQPLLDPYLASLLTQDRTALHTLTRDDPSAATLLAKALSGYATTRHFYDLRDQNTIASPSTPSLPPLARKRAAATSLLAALESAADCIPGGLYDPAVDSAVPTSCLLALLGEMLPLLGLPQRIWTKPQIFTLLRIVEDFATAPQRLRGEAEDLLRASVGSFRGAGLGKGKERDLGGSSWDLLASSTLPVQTGGNGKAPVGGAKGWDWRSGLDGLGGGVEVGAQEVVVLVRVALAQEVARGWGGGLGW